MTSYSIYKISNNKFDNYEDKNLFDTEFYLSEKGNYCLDELNKNFNLYEAKIKKIIKENIFVEINNEIQNIPIYTKIFKLDLIAFEKYLFVKGSYESRELFDKYLKEIKHIIAVNECYINLENILKSFSAFKSLSLKDYSASINKLKATGELEKDDDDIQEFLEKGGTITAITIPYPCGKEEINIHIKDDCSLRLNNCEEISTIEEEAKFIYNLMEELSSV